MNNTLLSLQGALAANQYVQVSTRKQLQNSLLQAQSRIEDLRRAIEILDRNPDLEELVTILSRFNIH